MTIKRFSCLGVVSFIGDALCKEPTTKKKTVFNSLKNKSVLIIKWDGFANINFFPLGVAFNTGLDGISKAEEKLVRLILKQRRNKYGERIFLDGFASSNS